VSAKIESDPSYDIRTAQDVPGLSGVVRTMIYTHVLLKLNVVEPGRIMDTQMDTALARDLPSPSFHSLVRR